MDEHLAVWKHYAAGAKEIYSIIKALSRSMFAMWLSVYPYLQEWFT